MRRRRNVLHYSKIIAGETGLPIWKVHLTLMIGWRHILRMMRNQEDVRLKGLGRLYVQKFKPAPPPPEEPTAERPLSEVYVDFLDDPEEQHP